MLDLLAEQIYRFDRAARRLPTQDWAALASEDREFYRAIVADMAERSLGLLMQPDGVLSHKEPE